MDLVEVIIKEEPVWHDEGTANTSLDNFEFVSGMIPVKEETNSEGTGPGPTQENTFQPSADIKEEICVEQDKVDLPVPHTKEENNVENVAVSIDAGERVQHCEKLNSTLAQWRSLQAQIGIQSRERPFQCKECNKSYFRQIDLKRHTLIHTGEGLYQCNICNKAFAFEGDRRRHMVVHSAERPFRCGVCNSMFTRRSSLLGHMVVHTRERPNQCKE